MNFKFLKQSVGAKIALMTIGAMLFVTVAFLAFFFVLDINWLTRLTFMQLLLIFALAQVCVGITIILFATNIFIKRPLEKFTSTMDLAEAGHSLTRISLKTGDEMEELAQSFNKMLARLTELDARKIETERELITVKEGLKYKEELESKARIIRTTSLKLEASLKNLSILYVVAQTLSQSLDLDELFESMSRVFKETLKLNHFALLIKNQEGFLEFALQEGVADIFKSDNTLLKIGEGLIGKVALDQMTLYIDNMSIESRPLYRADGPNPEGSYLVLPLKIGERLIGVLVMGKNDIEAFPDTEKNIIESVANQVALAFDRTRLYMQTKQLSVRDELTGIFNRRHFQEVLKMELKRAERFDRPLSLLMVDVDHFKEFNDMYGHIRGDMALKRLAKILNDNVREVDTVARFGGEEFIIVLADTELDDAKVVAQKLRHLVEEDFMKLWDSKQKSLPVTISIGVSSFPQIGLSEESLINAADLALYRAKSQGRNQVIVFDKVSFLQEEGALDDDLMPQKET